MPRPPACDVAAASLAPATKPMPVCTIGYRMPVSAVSRVGSGSGRAGPGRAGPGAAVRGHASSWSRRRSGSSWSRMMASSAAVGSLVCGTSSGAASTKPVASATSETETPGMHRPQPHRVLVTAEVQHRQVRHDGAQLVEAA